MYVYANIKQITAVNRPNYNRLNYETEGIPEDSPSNLEMCNKAPKFVNAFLHVARLGDRHVYNLTNYKKAQQSYSTEAVK